MQGGDGHAGDGIGQRTDLAREPGRGRFVDQKAEDYNQDRAQNIHVQRGGERNSPGTSATEPPSTKFHREVTIRAKEIVSALFTAAAPK